MLFQKTGPEGVESDGGIINTEALADFGSSRASIFFEAWDAT